MIYIWNLNPTDLKFKPYPIILHHVKCLAGWSTSWNQDCREKYQNPQTYRWHHPYGRKWRGTKETLDEGERGEWKSWLKLTRKTKILASGPITSRQIDGETMERVADFIFIFLGSKITVHGDCSHEIKRHLLLRRKAMMNPVRVLKAGIPLHWQKSI